MALPKEPRQKMINLMYLVLTALLALNVSNEILNAFKVVDNSLLSSNGVINGANTTIMNGLGEQAKKDELKDRVAIWKPRAEAAIAKAAEMSTMIDGIKARLKTASGLKTVEGKEVYKEDDLDAPTRFFVKQGEGKKLQDALQKYLNDLQAIVPKEDQKTPLPKLPIDLSVPATQNSTNKTWEDAYFHMTPSVAAITILSKFQNDVLRSGNLVANYCQEQVGKVVVVLDKFEILTSQSSSYLLPGQPLEIKAGIGAFSSNAKPTISINGVSQVANDSGFARYTTTASGSGGNIPISVQFKDPNTGTVITKNTSVSYTVGQPSGASIFLEKMNVMYLGVDNPLTISTGTGKAENARVSFSGGSITGSGSKWIAKPTTEGPATVTISVDGKSYPFPIRCKILPNPITLVGDKPGGRMPAAAFRVMGGVRAVLKDSDFDAQFLVVSYTLAGNGNGFSQYTAVPINGATWGSNAVISQCKPGSTIYIDDIKVKGPDGRIRQLPPMAFQLQ
ncbi:MAG: gliding motility protein GldM [Bacteroidetes bacterium]|nr:MAG: gliding motility protein GldM [Bacteroidota bacterium]